MDSRSLRDLVNDLGDILVQHPTLATALAFVWGLLLGSFLNVVVGRLPAVALDPDRADAWPGVLLRPGSHCPHCLLPIAWYHNLPLLGWLVLRGRCNDCSHPIPLRYPLLELAGGSLMAGAVFWHGPTVTGVMIGLFLLALLALAAIDLEHQILPDQIVLPLLWSGLVINAFGVLTTPQDAILGAVVGFLMLTGLRVGYRTLRGIDGMGQGDAKLVAAIGAWLGLQPTMTALLIAFVAGSLAGLVLHLLHRLGRQQCLPFGPGLALGALAASLGISLF